MFCNKCGQELPDDSAFCSKCGAQTTDAKATPSAEAVPTNKIGKWALLVVGVLLVIFIAYASTTSNTTTGMPTQDKILDDFQTYAQQLDVAPPNDTPTAQSSENGISTDIYQLENGNYLSIDTDEDTGQVCRVSLILVIMESPMDGAYTAGQYAVILVSMFELNENTATEIRTNLFDDINMVVNESRQCDGSFYQFGMSIDNGTFQVDVTEKES